MTRGVRGCSSSCPSPSCSSPWLCSAASSAEKRGELGGDPPHPPFPLRSGPCGKQLRKEMVGDKTPTFRASPVCPTTADDVHAPSERPGFRREYTVCRRATKAYAGARWRTNAYGGARGRERVSYFRRAGRKPTGARTADDASGSGRGKGRVGRGAGTVRKGGRGGVI